MSEAKVSVTALKFHTHDGKSYQEGAVYDVEASQVDNLVAQGMVVAPPVAQAQPKPSHPVGPLKVDDVHKK